ncbi:uncharacterized protein PODANS_1_13940 [Podospora anserina S mat+]|uniref:Podospora anserina S mat+ genomic DNA chromosome 1, supercontig 3 n=1 Tax=Podospora anserina (strain S / ATCC MYA-4624 / DSM 980 / FGSC 10383) TaxID=515849 RepID=B2AM17_PODAN|nr:uncharacterized protein PODANS_1_13940 [Podospora anserina S mat+]CAP65005.1 unnamed protein product [Podospora anserina S mat+]CDP23678.1 Putative protein of unknown function [Podospora anserina S mat+]
MDRNTPLSPSLPKGEPLPVGFNELLQHNAATPHDMNAADSIRVQSQPASRYGTPAPQLTHSQSFDPSMSYQRGVAQIVRVAIYPPWLKMLIMSQPYGTPAASPPTPSRASDIMSIHGGNIVIGKALAPRRAGVEKASSKKKKKERAKPPKNLPTLDRPLSDLTKDSAIPITDIETYVNRDATARQDEVTQCRKNPGKVKRPMNAFMLYRKAYQQRAKEWASQHNHQIVSRVCGSSWPLEPEHIRQQFKAWADLERDNHQKAHPNYKFTPSKPHKPAKYDENFDAHSEASDLDEYGDWQHAAARMRSATNTPNDDGDYIPSRSVYAATHHPLMGLHGLGPHHQNRSAFEFSNPGKPMPSAYDTRGLTNTFYESHIQNTQRSHLHPGMIEDVLMRKTPSPSMAFQQHTHGLPSHYELNQYHHPQHTRPSHEQQAHSQSQSQGHSQPQPPRFEHRIDPSLMSHEELFNGTNNLNNINNSISNLFDGTGLAGTNNSQHGWQTGQLTSNNNPENQFSHFNLGLDNTLSVEQHSQFLGGADEWRMEPLSEGAHFEANWAETKADQ